VSHCAVRRFRTAMVNRAGIAASNALVRGLGSQVEFLRTVVGESVHIELLVVAGTSLG
jgi:hypothetical protein